MSELTLDEAIKHCEEVAEEQSRLYSLCPCPCDGTTDCTSLKNGKDMGCTKCAADHRQLAEWLKELKSLRKKAEHLTEWNRKLIDYKNKIICKWGKSQEELQEAKRLLKTAVEDFSNMYDHIFDCDGMCDTCPLHGERDYCLKWRYADETLKLIRGSENE